MFYLKLLLLHLNGISFPKLLFQRGNRFTLEFHMVLYNQKNLDPYLILNANPCMVTHLLALTPIAHIFEHLVSLHPTKHLFLHDFGFPPDRILQELLITICSKKRKYLWISVKKLSKSKNWISNNLTGTMKGDVTSPICRIKFYPFI